MKPHTPLASFVFGFATLLCVRLSAEPFISEFMASNSRTLRDEDRDTPDWIELHNPDSAPADLSGWYLTDNPAKKTKWAFPEVTIPAHGYLVVFASGKNRREPGLPLHTNFSLDAAGEHLALVRPDGITTASEFGPAFPAQASDVSYGRTATPDVFAANTGYLSRPTPGSDNSEATNPPMLSRVSFSRPTGPFASAFNLELGGARAGEEIRYVVLPACAQGAAALTAPTSTSWRYEGPIRITASTMIRAAIFTNVGTQVSPACTMHYLNEAADGAELRPFHTALPVVVLGMHGAGPLDGNRVPCPGWVHVLDAAPDAAVFGRLPGVASPASLRVRGNSSALFPKKGYNIDLLADDGARNAQSLLGLPGSDAWALVSPWWYDRTYLHNAVMYNLSNRIGRWAPRTRFVEVFHDADGVLGAADYAGVSLLTERIKPGRLGLASLEPTDTTAPAITGGYLLKVDVPDAGDFSFVTDRGLPDMDNSAVVVVSPDTDTLNAEQREYIRGYVQQMEDALFAGRDSQWRDRSYLEFIDVPSWVDHHLLQTLAANLDAFFHSAYFHKHRGGKIVAGPVWDFDRALGSYDPRTQPAEGWDPGSVEMWASSWFGVLARDPEFQQAWIDRWQSLRESELATPALQFLCDALAAEVTPEAAARDAARWPDNVSATGGGFSGEVAALKDWLTRRAAWIDAQFVAPPVRTASAGTLTFTAPAGAQLVYTTDGSDPRSVGGAIAPNARVSDDPLTVDAGANVHVRSYDASLADVFPGSPWSSAIGGSESTPLAPRARLVNLSTRAIAAAGDDALVTGVVVEDAVNKRMLARVVGPGLSAFGATSFISDPQLSILDASGAAVLHNAGWFHSTDAAALSGVFQQAGAFPLSANSVDAAAVTEFGRGAHTVRAGSRTGSPGVCLSELYELDSNGRLASVAIRGRVGAGDAAFISGFVLKGAAHQRVLLRAIGLDLAESALPGALPDPVLSIYSAGKLLASTDQPRNEEDEDIAAKAAAAVGASMMGTDGAGAVLFVTLTPGAYTVQVTSRDGAEGRVVLEAYDVP